MSANLYLVCQKYRPCEKCVCVWACVFVYITCVRRKRFSQFKYFKIAQSRYKNRFPALFSTQACTDINIILCRFWVQWSFLYAGYEKKSYFVYRGLLFCCHGIKGAIQTCLYILTSQSRKFQFINASLLLNSVYYFQFHHTKARLGLLVSVPLLSHISRSNCLQKSAELTQNVIM